MTTKKVRLDYLDIAKALTIFLVIVGHTTANDVTPYYRLVLYTFHMPLFFMVSGVVVRRHRHEYNKEHWISFLRKNIIAIAIPYLLWAIIYTSLDYRLLGDIFYASWQTLSNIGTLTSLWFLPCLFVARILMELVLMISTYFKKIDRHVFAFIAAIVSLIIGLSLPALENGYPWCINCAFTALSFMLVGYSLKEVLDKKSNKFLLIHFVIFVVIFVSYLIYKGNDLEYVKMYKNEVSNLITFLVMGYSGCGMILTLSRIISNCWKDKESKIKTFVLWVGRSTIGIYLLHKPFLQEVVVPFLIKMGFVEDALITAIVGAIISFIYCCILIKIIERYIPQLFGKFNNERTIVIKESEINENEIES